MCMHMHTCTHAHMHTCTQAHMHTSNHQTWNNMGRNINANAMKHRSKNDVKLIKIYVKLIENPLKLVQNRSLEGSGGHVGPQDPPETPGHSGWGSGGHFLGPQNFIFGPPEGSLLSIFIRLRIFRQFFGDTISRCISDDFSRQSKW